MCATPRHAVGTLSRVKEWRSTDQRNCNRHAAPRRPLIAGRHPLHLWSAGLGHVALLQLQPFEKRTIRLQSLRAAALADQPLVDTQYLGSDDHAQALENMNVQQWTNPIAARSRFGCLPPATLHRPCINANRVISFANRQQLLQPFQPGAACGPIALELIFDGVKTRAFNRCHNSEIVPLVVSMLVVITHHAPFVASVQSMVDVRKVVPSHLTLRINPATRYALVKIF